MLIVEKNFNQGSFSLFSQHLEKVEKILMFYCFLVEEAKLDMVEINGESN